MLIEYIVFFSLCFVGILFYILNEIRVRKTNQQIPPKFEYQKCESPIESRLYRALVLRGEKVEAQVSCGFYRIDLVLRKYRIAIECDGKAYHSSEDQKAYDRRKNLYLRKKGWKVLRFTGSSINGKLDIVLAKIEKEKGV